MLILSQKQLKISNVNVIPVYNTENINLILNKNIQFLINHQLF